MKHEGRDNTNTSGASAKGEKVRTAIGKMLSSEERGKEPEREDAPGTLSSREPVPTTGGTVAEVAAQKRLAEIEEHVAKLVKDPELEQDSAKPSR